MGFTDRPIVTAGLGIAFALLLLVFLSSPTLLGNVSNSPANAGPLFGPANPNLVSSRGSSGTTPYSSSISSITTFTPETVSSAQSTSISSMSGGTGYSYTSSSTGTVTAYTTIVANYTTANASASTGSIQSGATGTPNASAVTSMTTAQKAATTTSVSTMPPAATTGTPFDSVYRTVFSTKNLLGSLGVLSAVSLAIALGSMFYVRRKFNSDSEEK